MSSYRADTAFADYLAAGRVSHAMLVECEDESAALSRAAQLAAAVLCGAENAPCGECRGCRKIKKGIHPDYIVFFGGERTRSFHVDSVREIRRQAHVLPNEAPAKVFVLQNAQNMTVQAQNALLKMIEEPPGNVVFILTCDNKASLLETVRSRVSVFSFAAVPAGGADGPADAFREKAKEIVAALLSGDEFSALAAFAPFERDRAGLEHLLDAARADAFGEYRALVKSGAKPGETARRLVRAAELAAELKNALSQNPGGLLMTVMLPARLYGPADDATSRAGSFYH